MKLPYAQVSIEIEKLYSQTTEVQLDERCKTIAAFLEACGWTEEEYQQQLMRELEDLTNDSDDLHSKDKSPS